MRAMGKGVQHAVIDGKRVVEEGSVLNVDLDGVMEQAKGKSKDVRCWVNADDKE